MGGLGTVEAMGVLGLGMAAAPIAKAYLSALWVTVNMWRPSSNL